MLAEDGAELFFLIAARKRPISLGVSARLLQHSGENLGQGQLDAANRVHDLAAYSQRPLLDRSSVVEDQHLQGIADVVVALGHYPEPTNVGGAMVILIPQRRVDESADDQQHERAVNPTAHGGIPRIDQPAGEQCAPSSHDEGSQGAPQDVEARIGLRQESGVRLQGRD